MDPNYWEQITYFVTANSSAIIASVSGGFFGAFGAQFISARYNAFESVKNELNSVSSAFILSVGICNRYIAMKRQLVMPMSERYIQIRDAYNQLNLSQKTVETFRFQAEYTALQEINLQISILESILFEKVSMRGRGLALVPALAGATVDLNSSIRARNDVISEFRENRQDDTVILE
jgi:hypothetical protein